MLNFEDFLPAPYVNNIFFGLKQIDEGGISIGLKSAFLNAMLLLAHAKLVKQRLGM